MNTKIRLSTGETTSNNVEHHQGLEEEGAIVLEVATKSQYGQVSLGIGVTVRRHPNTLMAEWALKERNLGDKTINEAVAIKLFCVKL